MLQVNEEGKKRKKKNLQGFKTGTLGLWWRRENKEKMGRTFSYGGKYDQFSSGEKENRDIEVIGRKDKD